MEPITTAAIPMLQKGVEAADKFGLGNVLSILVVGIFFYVIMMNYRSQKSTNDTSIEREKAQAALTSEREKREAERADKREERLATIINVSIDSFTKALGLLNQTLNNIQGSMQNFNSESQIRHDAALKDSQAHHQSTMDAHRMHKEDLHDFKGVLDKLEDRVGCKAKA